MAGTGSDPAALAAAGVLVAGGMAVAGAMSTAMSATSAVWEGAFVSLAVGVGSGARDEWGGGGQNADGGGANPAGAPENVGGEANGTADLFSGDPSGALSAPIPAPSALTRGSGDRDRLDALDDSEALLTAYVAEGLGSSSIAPLVELAHTANVRFLSPGILLRGAEEGYDPAWLGEAVDAASARRRERHSRHGVSGLDAHQHPPPAAARPAAVQARRVASAAAREGVAAWRVNPFFAAGRLSVPAAYDALVIAAFFHRRTLPGVLDELRGPEPAGAGAMGKEGDEKDAVVVGEEEGRRTATAAGRGGTPLALLPLPPTLAARALAPGSPPRENPLTFGEVADRLLCPPSELGSASTDWGAGEGGLGAIALGLRRRKVENPLWRLPYVRTAPARHELVRTTDLIYALLPRRGGEGLSLSPSLSNDSCGG